MKHSRLFFLFLTIFVLALFVPTAYADTIYVVQPGDSLEKIAHQYGMNYLVLAENNDIEEPYIIQVGQVLIIPEGSELLTFANPGFQVEESSFQEIPVVLDQTLTQEIYHVQSGESISRIAQQYATNYLDLAGLNNLRDPYIIGIGQELNVPCVIDLEEVQENLNEDLLDAINLGSLTIQNISSTEPGRIGDCLILADPTDPPDGDDIIDRLPGSGSGNGNVKLGSVPPSGTGSGIVTLTVARSKCFLGTPFIKISATGGAKLTSVKIFYLDNVKYEKNNVAVGTDVRYCGPFTHYEVEAPSTASWSVFSTIPINDQG